MEKLSNRKVSILVPIYGVENKIKECLVSLFEQTYNNIEYVFVNDATPDKSIEILENVIKQYPKRNNCIKIIHHPQNKGLSTARNTALKHAEGEYIMHVDSDDYIDITTIEKCMNNIENADIIFFGSYNKCGNKVYKNDVKSCDTIVEYIKGVIERRISPSICGAVYKKKLYLDNNIKAIDNLFMGEDYVTKPRLLYFANDIKFLKENLYFYNEPISRNIKEKDIEDLVNCIKILKDFFYTKNDYNIFENSLKKATTITKVTSLIQWALSKDKNLKVFNKINNGFPKENDYNLKGLNRKIILYLASQEQDNLLKLYINTIYKLKEYIR